MNLNLSKNKGDIIFDEYFRKVVNPSRPNPGRIEKIKLNFHFFFFRVFKVNKKQIGFNSAICWLFVDVIFFGFERISHICAFIQYPWANLAKKLSNLDSNMSSVFRRIMYNISIRLQRRTVCWRTQVFLLCYYLKN